MFIHIGNDNVIQSEDIISIIDFNVITSSSITEKMVLFAKKEEKIFGPGADAKSIVITDELVYYSSLSVPTLKKRASMISTINKLNDYSGEF